jgi:hypothetical protein
MVPLAFTKFDVRAFLENENQRGAAAKVAKAAKVMNAEGERGAAFAAFAAFAGAPAKIRNTEPPANDWTEMDDERAAIIEHDGGAPCAWAEALARLDPACRCFSSDQGVEPLTMPLPCRVPPRVRPPLPVCPGADERHTLVNLGGVQPM